MLLGLIKDSRQIRPIAFQDLQSKPFVLHAGSVLTIAGREIQALQYAPDGVTPDATYGAFPDLPVPISYPQTASVVMLTLEPPDYTVQVQLIISNALWAQDYTPSQHASLRCPHLSTQLGRIWPGCEGKLHTTPEGRQLLES